MIYRKKKYYYLITKEDLVFDMVKSSYQDIFSPGSEPDFDTIHKYENHLLSSSVKNLDDGFDYCLLPFSYSIDPAMAGLPFYTISGMRDELKDDKYAHNQESV